MKKLLLLATLSVATHAVHAEPNAKLTQVLAGIESLDKQGREKFTATHQAVIDSEAFQRFAEKMHQLTQSSTATNITEKVSPIVTPILKTMKNIEFAEKLKFLAALYIAYTVIPATVNGTYAAGKGLLSGAWSLTKGTANLGWGFTKGTANLGWGFTKGAANLGLNVTKGTANLGVNTVKGAANVTAASVRGAARGVKGIATAGKNLAGKCFSFFSSKKKEAVNHDDAYPLWSQNNQQKPELENDPLGLEALSLEVTPVDLDHLV